MARVFYKRFKNDVSAKEYMNSVISAPCTALCFSSYGFTYKGNDKEEDIYFGFLANKNISKLVQVMNRNFKNIKVKIVDMRELKTDNYSVLYADANGAKQYNHCLFRVVLNPEYSVQSNFILKLVIAQFVRVYSPYYSHYKKMQPVTKQYIRNALIAHDTSLYGGLICSDPSESHRIPIEVFNKLDNIELMNDITSDVVTSGMPKAYKLIRVLDGSKPKKFLTELALWE